MSDCLKVTNGALLQLALMTKMQQLNLSNCQQIAESGLVYLARQKNLKVRVKCSCESLANALLVVQLEELQSDRRGCEEVVGVQSARTTAAVGQSSHH